MTAVSVNKLTLEYGMKKILDGVTFAINDDDRLGIVGVNGSGKTSLFKLILGEERADSGEIYISKDKSIGVLTQDGAFKLPEGTDESLSPLEFMFLGFPELTSAEERLERMKKQLSAWSDVSENRVYSELMQKYTDLHDKYIQDGGLEFRSRCASILARMGFSEEMMRRPVETLSGGQRTRLAISRQLCRDPDILFLDEPTNHLDIETLMWLESYLASYKKCLLVISHDRYFLDRVTNKTLFIEHTKAKIYAGNYSRAKIKREEDIRVAEKHYYEQQAYIKHQEEYIAQQRAWGREKNIIRAESREKHLQKIERLELPKEAPRPIRLRFTQEHKSGTEVMAVRRLSFGYSPLKTLFAGLDFLIKQNERVFIIGKNGCGKSTLLKLLTGQLEPNEGYVEGGYNVEIGCYDQENRTLTDSNTVKDELWNAYPQKTELEIRSTLAAFRFVGDDIDKTVSVLSGGERARLMLAKLIMSHMNLLILDEPTNHLDISSREALEDAVKTFDGTVIAVSHDRAFINSLATRIIEICPGAGAPYGDMIDYKIENVGRGFDEYNEFKRGRINTSDGAKTEKVSEGRDAFRENKTQKSKERTEQRRLQNLAKEKDALEAELDEVTAELYGEAATDYKRAAELETRREEIEERLMEIYEEIGV